MSPFPHDFKPLEGDALLDFQRTHAGHTDVEWIYEERTFDALLTRGTTLTFTATLEQVSSIMDRSEGRGVMLRSAENGLLHFVHRDAIVDVRESPWAKLEEV